MENWTTSSSMDDKRWQAESARIHHDGYQDSPPQRESQTAAGYQDGTGQGQWLVPKGKCHSGRGKDPDKEREGREMRSLDVIYSHSLRELVERVNAKHIQQGDVVSVFREDNDYILLYYRVAYAGKER